MRAAGSKHPQQQQADDKARSCLARPLPPVSLSVTLQQVYTISLLGTLAVLVHAIIVFLHGDAHRALDVQLSIWQKSYAATVILITPLVAAVLLWTRRARAGLLLLAVSMAGSLFFGLYYHYFVVSADHVAHLPPGDAQGLFRVTAVLLAVTEVLGLAIGLAGLRTSAAKGHMEGEIEHG